MPLYAVMASTVFEIEAPDPGEAYEIARDLVLQGPYFEYDVEAI